MPQSFQKRQFASRPLLLMLLCLGCFVSMGCVHRRIVIRSNPPGALVLLDGKEIGYTPVASDFLYYGTREITLIKDGFETKTIQQRVQAPWFQYFPLDFFSDNFLGKKYRDKRSFHYQLEPRREFPDTNLIDRGQSLRNEALLGF